MQINVIKLTLATSALILSAVTARASTYGMFATQAEALAYFIKYKVKVLDRDKDGEACASFQYGSIHLLNNLQFAENRI